MNLRDVIAESRNVRTRYESGVTRPASASLPSFTFTSPPKRFRLTGVSADTLTCVEVSPLGVLGTATFTIAKPQRLRISTWHTKTIDGKTYTSVDAQSMTVAKSGATTETWVTNPKYQTAITNYVGDDILAVKPAGGTGIAGVIWEDVNDEGRAWGTT